MATVGSTGHPAGMKRAVAAVLWFFAGWYLGAFVAFVLDVPALLGPVVGLVAAVLIAGDPFGLIWERRTTRAVREQARKRLFEALPGS
jgi:hypothetical protein